MRRETENLLLVGPVLRAGRSAGVVSTGRVLHEGEPAGVPFGVGGVVDPAESPGRPVTGLLVESGVVGPQRVVPVLRPQRASVIDGHSGLAGDVPLVDQDLQTGSDVGRVVQGDSPLFLVGPRGTAVAVLTACHAHVVGDLGDPVPAVCVGEVDIPVVAGFAVVEVNTVVVADQWVRGDTGNGRPGGLPHIRFLRGDPQHDLGDDTVTAFDSGLRNRVSGE